MSALSCPLYDTILMRDSSLIHFVAVTTPAPLLRGSRQGTVVLRDDFDGTTLNEDNWEYEISMFGGYVSYILRALRFLFI